MSIRILVTILVSMAAVHAASLVTFLWLTHKAQRVLASERDKLVDLQDAYRTEVGRFVTATLEAELAACKGDFFPGGVSTNTTKGTA